MRYRGFTLIELLVCISITTVLLALLLPQVARSRAVAQKVLCASNLRQTGISYRVYMESNKEWVPRLAAGWTEVWDPGPQVVSVPVVPELVTQDVKDLFPNAKTRYCPTYGAVDMNANAEFRWTYSAPLLIENQGGQLWGEYILWHQTAGPYGAYVRLKETELRNPDGSVHLYYQTGQPLRPLYSFALMADLLHTNVSGDPRRAAPHNGGTAYSKEVRNIDSEGGNHLWMDNSVNWKVWPEDQRGGTPMPSLSLRGYPHEIVSGVAPPGWSAIGNYYYPIFFWVEGQR